MISNTTIAKRITRKKDPYVVDTIFAAKKSKKWNKVAQIVSASRRNYPNVNLAQIEKEAGNSETVVVPGKVLGTGQLTKKLKICAMYFSSSALDKIKQSKSEAIKLVDEIKKNPEAEGVKLIR